MNLRGGFKRITFVLSIIMSCLSLVVCVALVLDENDRAYGFLKWKQENYEAEYGYIESIEIDEKNVLKLKEAGFSEQEIKDFEKNEFDKLKSEQINAKKEIVGLQKGFLVNLSSAGLAGLCIFAGLGSVIVGFLGTWIIIWFGGLSVYMIIRWIVRGFYSDTTVKKNS